MPLDPTTDALRFAIGMTIGAEEIAAFNAAYGPAWLGHVLTQRGLRLGAGNRIERGHSWLRAPIRNVVH